MATPKTPLVLALLTFGLLAGSAARAGGDGDQAIADREGDQTGMTEAEVAPPLEAQTCEPEAVLGAHLYDATIMGILGKGNWGVDVVLLEPGGTVQQLSALHEDKPLMPASTMKVFTSWFGYVENEALRTEGKEPSFPAPWISYEAYAAHTLKVSDNDMAKAILKKYAPTDGPSVLEGFYANLGLAPQGTFKVVDGAGLATGNRATAHLEVALLEHIFNSEHYKSYRVMLAEPGQTGTLSGRLTDLNGSLYAKTGTLTRTRVAALTGFLEMGGAGTVIFSIIGNDASLSVPVQRARIDQVVERLHRDSLVANAPAAADATLVALRRKDLGAKLPDANLDFR
jgi:hypothetical protein